MEVVTSIAPINMAVIKYWGKRDEELILPINDSISCTLSTDRLCAKTTVMASPKFEDNKIWLNGKEENFDNKRIKNCLKEVKKRASPKKKEILDWNIHVCSENNFPTAAGLASSAAGYACLVYALCKLYEVEGDITGLARRGSGSACRSIYGGWIQWHMGIRPDGGDSLATQIAPATHWPNIRVLILVANDKRKKDSSSGGMKRSVETSEFITHRAEAVVPKRVASMIAAIKERDFNKFAELTMKDSNTFHAVCMDTFPPCLYLSHVSLAVIQMVHAYNNYHGMHKVAYTFDAGPNACLFLQESDLDEFASVIRHVFPAPNSEFVEYIKGIPLDMKPLSQKLTASLDLEQHEPGSLKYIIHTECGDGPKVLNDESEHLLNELGLPKKLQ